MARSTQLTRGEIAIAALRLLDAEGIGAFSVRRVADELGSGTMSLYRHVQDRNDLIVAMADELLDVPLAEATRSGDWQDRVRATAHTARRLAMEHRAAMAIVIGSTPPGLMARRLLGALRLGDSELTPQQSSLVGQAVLPFLAGWCLAESSQRGREVTREGAFLNRFDDVIEVILAGLVQRFEREAERA